MAQSERSPHRKLENGPPGQLAQVHSRDHLLKAVAARVGRLLIQLPVNLQAISCLLEGCALNGFWHASSSV